MNIVGTLRIDGVLYNLSISPVAGGALIVPREPGEEQPSLPVPMPPPAAPLEKPRNGAAQRKNILLVSYSSKTGISAKNGKPYTLHRFIGADQKDYVTFRQEIASALGASVAKNVVSLYVEPDAKGIGYSILSIDSVAERKIV